MPKKTKKILFALSGLGLGNATRQHALIQELVRVCLEDSVQLEISICTWGKALDYFRSNDCKESIYSLAAYPKKSERLRALKIICAFLQNSFLLWRQKKRFKPDIILLDSDYHWPAYFTDRSKCVFIGQARSIVRHSKFYRSNWSFQQWKNFLFHELSDYLYQKIFSYFILIPSFTPTPRKVSDREYEIPLIVRRAYHSPITAGQTGKSAILLSGSGLECEPLLELAQRKKWKVIGPSEEALMVDTSKSCIDEFDILLTQGGLSTISECIARGKPMWISPMKNHVEQEVNAKIVEKFGWGTTSSEFFPPKSPPAPLALAMTRGASVAANFLLEKNAP